MYTIFQHSLNSQSFQSVMSVRQIQLSCALRLEEIFHQLVEIEVIDFRRSSIHKKISANAQWYVTGFAVQLLGFRRSAQFSATSGSDLMNRTMKIQCPTFPSYMLRLD